MGLLLIHGGQVVSPADRLDDRLDILVVGGIIRHIGRRTGQELPARPRVDESVDATGAIVCPGFIDLHAHLREPGGEESETLATGLAAAVAGGFAAVCAMPNTRPVNDNPSLTRALIEKASEIGLARLFPIAAVTKGSAGEELTHFSALKEAGALAFSDDGRPVATVELMREALAQARDLEMPIIDHCEDLALSARGAVNERTASALGVRGIPNEAEEAVISRDVALAAETGGRLHVAHLSTARGLEIVRAAKARGVQVTCEVTPHHFTLTDDAVAEYGTAAKMNPPLRSARDREAMISGLADGTIDAIATDHAPHAAHLKAQPLSAAPFGVTGLETALGLAITQLVNRGLISMDRLVELMSTRPAQLLRLDAMGFGRLREGDPANITVFDPGREWTYHAAAGHSKSRNSPFDGWRMKGAVLATVVAGRIVSRQNV